MKKSVFAIILFALPLLAFNGQLDVRVEIPSRDAIAELVEAGLGIDNYISTTGEVYGVILEHQLDDLLALKYPVEILPITDARVLAAMAKEPSGYPLHAEYVSFMQNIANTYPVIAKLDTIGYSIGGRPLLMMKISKQVAWELPKPEFCYISTMHGDETAGMIFLMWFLDSLTQNYGTDPRITRLVDSTAIYINPLMNPDGYVRVRRNNHNTADGLDLNRNFAVPDGVRGDDDSWVAQPETRAMVNFFNGRNISYTMNFHGGALVANYPWDYTYTRCPDDSLYIFLARNYADRNVPMFNNSTGAFDHGIVNGADWYIVKGSMQDFSYWLRGDLHITIELGPKTPPYDSLSIMWNDNYDAFLAGIEVCLDHGIHGSVTDSATGEPLAATITITPPGRDTYSDSVNGYYHRILLAGAVEVTVSAPGYITKTSSIVIPATGLARLDFDLVSVNPITVFRTDFEADNGGFVTRSFGSNPQDWRWGEPSLGIIAPHSGGKLWATILTGQYNNQSKSRLVLEDIALPDAEGITLSFFHWYSFQAIASSAFHDGGNIKLWTASGDSAILEPTPDYDIAQSEWNQFIPYQQSFADISYANQWREVRCDLSPWRGQTVDVSWDFGSSMNNVQVGWHIDDVWIYYPSDTALFAEESPKLPEKLTISAYPNPFNSAVSITATACAKIEIFDVNGRRVYVIPDRPRENGDQESGEASKNLDSRFHGNDRTVVWQPDENIGSGIYLIRAISGMDAVSKRVVYLK